MTVDYDQEDWIPTEQHIRQAVSSAYARLPRDTGFLTILNWTEMACNAFPKDQDAAMRYLLDLLHNAEEDEDG